MGHGVKAEIRFYGGVEGRIGGNIVALVLSKNGENFTFFFDMGVHLPDYIKRTRYRVELRTLEQFQRWRLVPDFGQLGDVRACFITHAHTDHWRALPAFKNSSFAPKVIWASCTTKKIIGNNSIRDFPLTSKPFEEYIFFEDGGLKKSGIEVKVAPFPTDHPILGSCAWIIEIENNIILYTGDFRDHGLLNSLLNKRQQFWTYTKKRAQLKRKDVIVITEGTNYGTPERFFTEEQLRARLTELIKNFSSELITIIISERDLWRLLTIVEVVRDINKSKATDRRIIYSRSIAKLCRKVYESFTKDYRSVLAVRDLNRLRSALLIQESRELSDETLLEASHNPSKFLFVATTREGFVTLDQIARRYQGGCCILSLSETVRAEAGISTRDYAREIAELGFSVEEVHSSGHVSINRLVDILGYIQPKEIFVMHSLAPEGMCKFIKARTGLKALAPSLGKNYEIN